MRHRPALGRRQVSPERRDLGYEGNKGNKVRKSRTPLGRISDRTGILKESEVRILHAKK